jgi:hypothetical protein
MAMAARGFLRQNSLPVTPIRSSPRGAFALAVVLASLLRPAAAGAAEPWEGQPLSGDPAAILAAARALPPVRGVPVDVLLEEGIFRYDERGAVTFSYRLVYRPLSREAARSWSRIERSWAPWHQARPEIQARSTPTGACCRARSPPSSPTRSWRS